MISCLIILALMISCLCHGFEDDSLSKSVVEDTDTFQTDAAAASFHDIELLACELYLAPSTIPGAGLGFFTGIPREPGDRIGNGDVCIPVIDVTWHHDEGDMRNPLADYYWNGNIMGMGREGREEVQAYCPGLDCAANSPLNLLVNLHLTELVYDDYASLHRARDPGAGAFTPYHNATSTVSQHVPAGGELFKFYEDAWIEHRSEVFDGDDNLHNSLDYPGAEALLRKLVESTNETAMQSHVYELLLQLRSSLPSRVLRALPETWSANIVDTLTKALQEHHGRSPEWLAQHGRCLDHLRTGPSTIPQAGRGAFAKRRLPHGTIVTTSPVLLVPDYKVMELYNLTRNADGSYHRHVDKIHGFQLLINYCMGHAESTVLICPYGAGINYMNHHNGDAAPNVRLQWAETFVFGHNHSFLDWSVAELAQLRNPALAVDYVALRDIDEGEELLLDYGTDWQEAWDRHVAGYHALGENVERYISGASWNARLADSMIKTEDEQFYDPYPGNLQLRCHSHLMKGPNATFSWHMLEYGLPCRILDRFVEDNEVLYTVELAWTRQATEETLNESLLWIQETDVPRTAIAFFDRPGTTDLYLANAFRHEIGIPDEMMPEQWKNIDDTSEEDDDEIREAWEYDV